MKERLGSSTNTPGGLNSAATTGFTSGGNTTTKNNINNINNLNINNLHQNSLIINNIAKNNSNSLVNSHNTNPTTNFIKKNSEEKINNIINPLTKSSNFDLKNKGQNNKNFKTIETIKKDFSISVRDSNKSPVNKIQSKKSSSNKNQFALLVKKTSIKSINDFNTLQTSAELKNRIYSAVPIGSGAVSGVGGGNLGAAGPHTHIANSAINVNNTNANNPYNTNNKKVQHKYYISESNLNYLQTEPSKQSDSHRILSYKGNKLSSKLKKY